MAENNGYTNGAFGNYRQVDPQVGDPWEGVDMNSPQQVIAARNKQENVDYKLFNDSGDSAIYDLARKLNIKIDPQTKDYLIQYYLGQKSDDAAMQRSLKLTEDQYSSLVRGLRSAGLNPFLALQGLSGANAMTGQGVNGGLYTQQEASKRQQQNQQLATGGSILATILMGLAMVLAHVL